MRGRGAQKVMLKKSFETLAKLLEHIEVTDNNGSRISLDDSANKVLDLFLACRSAGNKLMFIGNGASATISSHMATDYTKNGSIRAVAFNDSSLLTCFANDYGYEHLFEKAIEFYAEPGDILIAISSSGRSPNILNAAKMATQMCCTVITLSGFKSDNPLRQMGGLNYYVPKDNYSYIEILHHAICHLLLDGVIDARECSSND